MKDTEIIKALECCSNADCENCPQWSEEWYSGRCNDFLLTVIDLINRQKAEIERLKDYNENLIAANIGLSFSLLDEIKAARTKAIKEFAEMVEENSVYYFATGRMEIDSLDFYHLLTEMTEGV